MSDLYGPTVRQAHVHFELWCPDMWAVGDNPIKGLDGPS